MYRRQIDLRPHHQRHHLIKSIFAVAIVSLLTACGTANINPQPTPEPTVTPTQPLTNLTLYATGDTGMLYALKADTGQLRWQGQAGKLSGGTPVIENGIVYTGSQNTVYAFKASDGMPLWSSQGYNQPTGPLVAEGKVFVDYYTSESGGSVNVSIAALKGSDGSQIWSKQLVTHSTAPISTPGTFGQLVANGVFYVTVNTQPGQFLLYAFNASNGDQLWQSSGTFTDGNYASLSVENGVVFVYVDRLYAYKASDGTRLRQSQGASQPLMSRYDLFINQGTMYADTRNGLVAYNTNNGNQLWHVPVDSSHNSFLEITLANGVIYAAQQFGASALDARTGKLLWSYKTKSQDWGNATYAGFLSPLTDNNTLYISNFMSGLAALNLHTGNLRWRVQVGGNGIRPTLVGSTWFTGSGDGVIAAVNGKDGKVLWRFATDVGMSFPSGLTVGTERGAV